TYGTPSLAVVGHRFSGADSAGAMGTPAPAPLKGVPYVRDAFTRGRRAPLHRCRFRRRDGAPAPAPLKGVPYVRDAFTRGRMAPLHRCRFRPYQAIRTARATSARPETLSQRARAPEAPDVIVPLHAAPSSTRVSAAATHDCALN